jgi:uncharacterized protein YbjT (DUF2867 family)
MAEKKTIAVVGATGAQGGGLVRAILSDVNSGFTARALTRNVNSDKATALAKLGADVVAADLDEIESLRRAFEGAYGAFCVTNFWEHFSPEKELAQATNMARAAKEAGLEHVIWSTLEDYAPVGATERRSHADARHKPDHKSNEWPCRSTNPVIATPKGSGIRSSRILKRYRITI